MVLLWKLIPAIQSGRFFRRLDWHNYLFIKDKKLFITQNNETKECHLEFEHIIADDWELVDISYQINGRK